MAKINFGQTVNDARGKLGGTVFSKNKSGAYTRRKVTPANPRTVAQSRVRNFFGTLKLRACGQPMRLTCSNYGKAKDVETTHKGRIGIWSELNAPLIKAFTDSLTLRPSSLANASSPSLIVPGSVMWTLRLLLIALNMLPLWP
jgi:hypothetical protein